MLLSPARSAALISFGKPQPRILVGVFGSLLTAGSLSLEPALGGGLGISLLPAIIMSVALLGGWITAAACALVTLLAGVLSGSDAYQVAVSSAVAVCCGELLRRGVRPIVVAGLQFLTVFASHLNLVASSENLAVVELCAAAIAHAGVNVAVASAVLTCMPRRSRYYSGRCRVRWDHIVFALTVGTLSLTALLLLVWTRPHAQPTGEGWGETTALRLCGLVLAAVLANIALTSRFNSIASCLPKCFRIGPPAASRRGLPAGGELPLEMAPFLLEVNRGASRLRRDAARHSRELLSAQEQVHRLKLEVQQAREELDEQGAWLRKVGRSNEYARARYHTLMELSPDGTLFADADGTIQSTSRSIVRILGFQPIELKGKPLSLLIPADWTLEHPLNVKGKDPEQGAMSIRDVVVRSRSGKNKEVAALVQAFRVRGRVNYAVQLRETGRMKTALATLERARTLTQSAHRSRDLFIAAMSHELRTPLHGLIATLDMMRVGANCPPEFEQRLSIARISARTLLKIANDILDLTRIDSGHFPLEQRPFAPRTMLEEIVDESRARADSMGLKVEVRVIDALPPAFIGDPERLKQILSNLVSNALKFTRAGGVTLQVGYAEGRCTVDVIDTGMGIPRDKWESIFDPFVQVQSGAERHVGGTGLGLPISRRLAEAMGGRLTLLRSGSTGSTFRLAVPLPASSEVPAEEQSQRIFNNPRGRILVVEDNAANRYVAEALLGNLDCPATIVESGAEALDLIAQQDFDLILMDCQMPELDGYETTRRVRRLLKRHVPIIAMTANAMIDDKKRCLEAGMDDFLPKPFGRPALHSVLCKWLESASAGQRATEELESKVSQLPALDVDVFQELRQSLRWKREPLARICTTFTSAAQSAFSTADGSTGIDRRALRRHLHTLLGSAGMVGARQAEYIARKLQSDVDSNRMEDVTPILELLKDALQRFEVEFCRRLDEVHEDAGQASRACRGQTIEVRGNATARRS